MERKVGDTFDCEGIPVKVEELKKINRCPDCIFHNQSCWKYNIKDSTGECNEMYREDGKNVIFVKNTYNGK